MAKIEKIWTKDSYYKKASEGSLNFNHPAMKKLVEICRDGKNILDLGSGEGSRLNKLIKKGQNGWGIDISPKAVEIAKNKYPYLNFKVGNLGKLPYKKDLFDVVYSAFVFEHLKNPEKAILEAMRVLKKGGKLLIVAPNFGSPNRCSPPFKGNRMYKFLKGFVADFFPKAGLGWHSVVPIATPTRYEIDWDTTIEPYLGSLVRFIKKRGLKIKYYSSCWSEESLKNGFLQKLFGFLGKIGIYPFNLWGPHLLVIAEK